MLQGRTLSYSDTQRHRVGTNYLQLPINQPKTHVATNQRDGAMAYHVDGVNSGENPHINYEPSSRHGLREAPRTGQDATPYISGNLGRHAIERKNTFKQAGETYRKFQDWERDELISNLVGNLKQCNPDIQERMLYNLTQADANYGARVAEGLGLAVKTPVANGD